MDKIKILVVEDETIVSLDLKRALQQLGYQVIKNLRRGEDAINYFKVNNILPDLIMMDIRLAGKMDGTEAATEIKKLYNIPVIFITAYSDDQTINTVRMTNPFGYILKPFEERMLYISIEMALYKHRLESNLQESEKRYRYLVENSPVGIAICTEERVLYANPAAVELFGAKKQEDIFQHHLSYYFMNSSLFQAISSGMKDPASAMGFKAPASQKLMRADGKITEVEISAVPGYYNNEPAVHLIIKDISDILKREKYQLLLNKILEAGNSSNSLEELYGLLNDVINNVLPGISFYFVLLNENKELKNYYPVYAGQSKILSPIEDEVIISGVPRLLRRDELNEEESLVADAQCWSLMPIRFNKEIKGVLVFSNYNKQTCFTDDEQEILHLIADPIATRIEKRIVDDEKTEYTTKLKELNTAKDKFFSMLSHDLRSPFNSMLGFMEILKNEYNELSDEEREYFINLVFDSSKNIYEQLNTLLEYSQSKTGATKYIPQKLNLNYILSKTVKLMQGNAIAKEIKIRMDIPGDIFVQAQEEMLVSLFQNLISNSIKFTRRGGCININCRVNDHYVVSEITDNGIGMDELKVKNLFRIEAKKSTPGTENENGTGLGLLLVKEFLDKCGGKIDVKSVPGNGTTFFVNLPKA